MIRKLLAIGAVVLIAGTGLAVGLGPAPGAFDPSSVDFDPAADGDDADVDSFPTETPGSSSGSAAEGTDGESGGTATAPPFTFTVDRVEHCGETCRDVTTTLTNEQSTSASSVRVHTRIYAGNGTEGDVVWEGTEPVGHLGPDESTTATERVELSLTDAYAIKRHDGWITVQTTVESDGEITTFAERRDVA